MISGNENSIEYRRRAVFTGLKMFLNEEALMESLCIWQRHYSDKPKFAITRFINHLIKDYRLEKRRQELQGELARLLMAPAKSLDEDPLEMMHDYARKKGLICSDSPGETALRKNEENSESRVFRLFVVELENHLRHRDILLVTRMVDTLKRQLRDSIYPVADMKLFVSWLDQRSTPLTVALDREMLHEMINAVYVLLCKSFGPVETDHIFDLVMRTVESSPQAGGVSPRLLL